MSAPSSAAASVPSTVPLFAPLTLRGVTFRNRIFVSPMCEYSSVDGMPNDWHFVHLGSRAVGGAGLVFAEATAVSAAGRISPADTGLWNQEQAQAWRRSTEFIRAQGAASGVQLAHAGRKASTRIHWEGSGSLPADAHPWQTIAPSAIPFAEGYAAPHALTQDEMANVVEEWVASTRLAHDAGFDVIELHAAHGYLLHQFLSPLSNRRTDEYGGSLENRMRYPLRVARAVREAWPAPLPLFVRISATDWVDGGWDADQSVVLARELRAVGVDLVDCSTGGNVPHVRVPVAPGYQVPFAERVRREAGIPTVAVGLITEPTQANEIVATGQADAVMLARELLRDPYWPVRAAGELGVEGPWPVQYLRARR